jgi:hypothetical protein
MNEKQELFGTSFRKAQNVLDAIKQHNITPDMDEDAIKQLVIKLAQAKVDLDGGKLSDYVGGQEWYVNSLIAKSALTDKELIDGEYKSLLVDNSSLEELSSMLKR